MPAAIVSRGRGSRPASPCARRYGGAPLQQTACRGGDHGRITHNPPSPPRRPCFLSANNPAVLKVFFFFQIFPASCVRRTKHADSPPSYDPKKRRKRTQRRPETRRPSAGAFKGRPRIQGNPERCGSPSLLLLLLPPGESMQGVENRGMEGGRALRARHWVALNSRER